MKISENSEKIYFFLNLTINLYSKYPYLRRFNKLVILADMKIMTGETLTEIANALGISTDATEKRLQTQGIKPVTREALYPMGTTERLRHVPGRGRPKKPRSETMDKAANPGK
jgi:hypothetical protein